MTAIVDASAFLGPWPFRPTWLGDAEALSNALGRHGIGTCLVAPTAALLVDDPAAANRELIEAAGRCPALEPVAAWNPSMPNAADAVAAAQAAGAVAVKLTPGYHDYELDAEALAPALDALEAARLPACIQLRVEDQRQARLLVPDVPVEDALALAEARPGIRWVLCGGHTPELLGMADRLAAAGNVWAEVSHADGVACLERLAGALPADRLLFATHMPFFYPEANVLKLVESDLLLDVRDALLWRNAAELFGLEPGG